MLSSLLPSSICYLHVTYYTNALEVTSRELPGSATTAIMALTQLAHSASALLPLVLPSIAAILAFAVFQRFFAPNPLSNLPIVGEEYHGYEKKRQAYLTKAKDLYLGGYTKVCLTLGCGCTGKR